MGNRPIRLRRQLTRKGGQALLTCWVLAAAAVLLLPASKSEAAEGSAFGEFTALTPARVMDTRTGNGRGGATAPLGANQSFAVQITGRGGVPTTGVSAVVMNVTVTEPTQPSYLTVWPTGLPVPEISNLNYLPGQTVPNLVTIAVGTGGQVSAFNRFGSTHVIFDVVGFYADAAGPSGSRFHAIDPYRYFDTRDGSGGVGVDPVGPDSKLRFKATGIGGVPGGGVSGVVMNVTITQPTQPSYLTVYPGDVSVPPTASNLNYLPGMTVPNLVTVRVPANGIIDFYNRFGTVHVIADVVGYYDDDKTTDAGRFVGLTPSRIFDSRVDFTDPFFEDSGTTLAIAGFDGVPLAGAGAAVFNVTATQTTAPGYVTVFPDDLCDVPLASNLNFGPGQTVPNLVMVRIASPGGCADPDFPGGIYLYNRFGFTHLIVDLFGYFTDGSSYDEYVTITDDTGTISIDVPIEWNDIYSAPAGDPPEPSLVASTDIGIFLDGWDVPAVWARVSETAAATYPTPAEYLDSLEFNNLTVCVTTDSGPYDDGTYVGNFVSAERCGPGNKGGYLLVVAQALGTDYYVMMEFNTITPRDVDAVDTILASLDVDPSGTPPLTFTPAGWTIELHTVGEGVHTVSMTADVSPLNVDEVQWLGGSLRWAQTEVACVPSPSEVRAMTTCESATSTKRPNVPKPACRTPSTPTASLRRHAYSFPSRGLSGRSVHPSTWSPDGTR